MCGDNEALVGNTKVFEHRGCFSHGLPVGTASHYNGDEWVGCGHSEVRGALLKGSEGVRRERLQAVTGGLPLWFTEFDFDFCNCLTSFHGEFHQISRFGGHELFDESLVAFDLLICNFGDQITSGDSGFGSR